MIKRKNSSFASTSSPWFHRNSFLSRSMIDDEATSVYESHSFFPDAQPYNIISLRESQGFVFNQDLFATPYQQLRSLAREKRIRAMSFSRTKSRSNSTSCSSSPKPKQRRHTSHDIRPGHEIRSIFRETARNESAIDDDSMEIDDDSHYQTQFESSFLDNVPPIDSKVEEYEEYEEDSEYGSLGGHYRVQVTDIIVNENDTSFLPDTSLHS